jgi:hypothetical protein
MAYHDVFRFDVPMDDSVGMGHGQGFRRLPGDRNQGSDGHGRCSEGMQGLPVDELHRDEIGSTGDLADLINRNDIGMIERRGGLCLLSETTDPAQVVRASGMQDFERDEAIKIDVARLVDESHAAFAKQLQYFIARDSLPDHSIPACKGKT